MGIKWCPPTDDRGQFAWRYCRNGDHPVHLHESQVYVLENRAKDKTIVAGRRFGKTWVQAIETIIFAIDHPGSEQYIIAPTQDQANIIFACIELFMNGPLQCLIAKTRYSPFAQQLWHNGSSIHSRSAGNDGKYLRGHSADRIVYDEASYIPTLVMNEAAAPMLAASELGYVCRISTPYGKNHFWESYATAVRKMPDEPDEYFACQMPSWLNPYVTTTGYLKRQREQLTDLAWAVEYGAEFHEDQNVMFPWRTIQTCWNADLPHPLDPVPGHRYVIGYDPAKWHDRSGLVVLDATGSHLVVAAIQDLSGRDYTIQEEMVRVYAERYNDAVVLMDATSHDRTLEALGAFGLEVYGYKFTNETKWELMSNLALKMERHDLTFPKHDELIKELQYYEMVLKPSGLPKLGAPEGKFDDFATALALAVLQSGYAPATIGLDFAPMG